MLSEDENTKDTTDQNFGIVVKDTTVYVSYSKTDKLILALYMVTDILDKDEPIKNKLRTLGTGIISDMHYMPANALSKISEIMSFLDIVSAVRVISEMNCSILRKEFIELSQSIKEATKEDKAFDNKVDLSGFFDEDNKELVSQKKTIYKKDGYQSIGHPSSTRLGVQKGGTLMKVLSDRMSNRKGKFLMSDRSGNKINTNNNFGVFKKKRRYDILKIIKAIGGNAAIKDIKNKANEESFQTDTIVSCSEKTLQRELVSMVQDNVLYKTGEKRWSRYSIKN